MLKENNFTVMAYAADGDSGYSPLVSQTINQWNHKTRPILNLEIRSL